MLALACLLRSSMFQAVEPQTDDKQKAIQALFNETGMDKRTDDISKDFVEAIRSKLYDGLVATYMKTNASMEQKEAERIARTCTNSGSLQTQIMDEFQKNHHQKLTEMREEAGKGMLTA